MLDFRQQCGTDAEQFTPYLKTSFLSDGFDASMTQVMVSLVVMTVTLTMMV